MREEGLEKEMEISGLIGALYWAKRGLLIFSFNLGAGVTFWIYGHWPFLWWTIGAISFSFDR